MKTLFISDLHLSEHAPAITDKLYELLDNLPEQTSEIYILGDLFEVWIGDDGMSTFQKDIARRFERLSKQVKIYFMPGNRDFLVGKSFCRQSGLQYIRDPYVIQSARYPNLTFAW